MRSTVVLQTKYKLLAVVESIKDAERLCKECNINKLNLGGTKATAETRNISKAMNITPAEETILKDYVNQVWM